MSAPSALSVVVADDHPLYREALAAAVRSRHGLDLVGEAETGAEAIALVERLMPNVLVLDVRMPDLDGTEVLGAIQRESLDTRVVMISGYLDGSLAYDVVARGAAACFSKLAKASEICDAIFDVARGETVLPSEIQSNIASEIRQRATAERPSLSQREEEILRMISAGASAPEIAGRLGLSTGTVKTHLRHIYEKLGVSDRAAAVAEAMRRHILP